MQGDCLSVFKERSSSAEGWASRLEGARNLLRDRLGVVRWQRERVIDDDAVTDDHDGIGIKRVQLGEPGAGRCGRCLRVL